MIETFQYELGIPLQLVELAYAVTQSRKGNKCSAAWVIAEYGEELRDDGNHEYRILDLRQSIVRAVKAHKTKTSHDDDTPLLLLFYELYAVTDTITTSSFIDTVRAVMLMYLRKNGDILPLVKWDVSNMETNFIGLFKSPPNTDQIPISIWRNVCVQLDVFSNSVNAKVKNHYQEWNNAIENLNNENAKKANLKESDANITAKIDEAIKRAKNVSDEAFKNLKGLIGALILTEDALKLQGLFFNNLERVDRSSSDQDSMIKLPFHILSSVAIMTSFTPRLNLLEFAVNVTERLENFELDDEHPLIIARINSMQHPCLPICRSYTAVTDHDIFGGLLNHIEKTEDHKWVLPRTLFERGATELQWYENSNDNLIDQGVDKTPGRPKERSVLTVMQYRCFLTKTAFGYRNTSRVETRQGLLKIANVTANVKKNWSQEDGMRIGSLTGTREFKNLKIRQTMKADLLLCLYASTPLRFIFTLTERVSIKSIRNQTENEKLDLLYRPVYCPQLVSFEDDNSTVRSMADNTHWFVPFWRASSTSSANGVDVRFIIYQHSITVQVERAESILELETIFKIAGELIRSASKLPVAKKNDFLREPHSLSKVQTLSRVNDVKVIGNRKRRDEPLARQMTVDEMKKELENQDDNTDDMITLIDRSEGDDGHPLWNSKRYIHACKEKNPNRLEFCKEETLHKLYERRRNDMEECRNDEKLSLEEQDPVFRKVLLKVKPRYANEDFRYSLPARPLWNFERFQKVCNDLHSTKNAICDDREKLKHAYYAPFAITANGVPIGKESPKIISERAIMNEILDRMDKGPKPTREELKEFTLGAWQDKENEVPGESDVFYTCPAVDEKYLYFKREQGTGDFAPHCMPYIGGQWGPFDVKAVSKTNPKPSAKNNASINIRRAGLSDILRYH